MADSTSLEPRISSLETAVSALTKDVGDLVKGMGALQQMVAAGAKAQWPSIFAGLGITIAIITAVGALAMTPIRENARTANEQIAVVAKSLVDVAVVQGRHEERFLTLQAGVSRNSDAISKLDTDLQREMRTLDASGDVKLNNMDRRLQDEITRNNATRQAMHDMQAADIARIEGRVSSTEKCVSDLAGLRERVSALERSAYGAQK